MEPLRLRPYPSVGRACARPFYRLGERLLVLGMPALVAACIPSDEPSASTPLPTESTAESLVTCPPGAVQDCNYDIVCTGFPPRCHAKYICTCANVFSVTSYGAIPNDGVDDTCAIQATIDTANAAGLGAVVFPAGQFELTIQRASGDGGAAPAQSSCQAAIPTTTVAGCSSSYTTPNTALTIPGPNIGLSGAGAGATILHLADQQGPYLALVYAGNADATGLIVSGLTFDGNSENNAVAATPGELEDLYSPNCGGCLDCEIGIFTLVGSNQTVQQSSFTNFDNNSILDLSGASVSVTNTTFTNIGAGAGYHDHSSIVASANNIEIANNTFIAAGGNAAVTAIETHSYGYPPVPKGMVTPQLVTGNVVQNYFNGMNLSGQSYIPTSGVTVTHNQLSGVTAGIILWSAPLFADPTQCLELPFGDLSKCFNADAGPTPYALSNVLLDSNTIGVDLTHLQAAQLHLVPGGIVLYPYSQLGVQNLTISNNVITGAQAGGTYIPDDGWPGGVGPAGVSFARAAAFPCVTLKDPCSAQACVGGVCDSTKGPNVCCGGPPPTTDDTLVITTNSIINMPAAGIVLEPEGPALNGLSITSNTITNPGYRYPVVSPPYQLPRDLMDGIVLLSDVGGTTFATQAITGNRINDYQSQAVARFGIDLNDAHVTELQSPSTISGNSLFYCSSASPTPATCLVREPPSGLIPPPTNEPTPCMSPYQPPICP
jgi:hypothetical protein